VKRSKSWPINDSKRFRMPTNSWFKNEPCRKTLYFLIFIYKISISQVQLNWHRTNAIRCRGLWRAQAAIRSGLTAFHRAQDPPAQDRRDKHPYVGILRIKRPFPTRRLGSREGFEAAGRSRIKALHRIQGQGGEGAFNRRNTSVF
jgi:hypothetical protein